MIESNDETDWSEIDGYAKQHRERVDRKRTAPLSTHIADIEDTDTSDERRYSLGISNVDRDFGTMRPGGITVVGALTGNGKTVLAEQSAVVNAKKYTILFATLEQTEQEIRDSIIARTMGKTLDEAEREMRDKSEAYLKARSGLSDMNFHTFHPKAKDRTPQRLLEVADKAHADVLIIDHARYITGWDGGKASNDLVAYLSEAVKESRLHLMVLAQLRFTNAAKRPVLDDFADSTRLAQEAEKVIMIYRPFAGHKTKDTIAEMLSPKNRKGKMFRGHVHWFGPVRTFYSMDDAEEARCECCKPKTRKKTPMLGPDPEPEDMTREEEDALLESLPFPRP